MSNILSSLFPSFFKGLSYLCILFLICTVFVIGFKVIAVQVFLFFKNKKIPEAKKVENNPPKKPKRPPTKTIEINPDEVNKIYVRKSS
jgi:hypothetical protein